MILDRDLAIRVFEEKIETLNHAMSKAKDTQACREIGSERAEAMKTLAEFVEKRNKELTEFQKEQGKNAPGRVVDLPHDWWNDEESEPDQASKIPHDSCNGEDLARLFNDGSNDHNLVQVADYPRECCKDEEEDPGRLMTPFDDRWNDDDVTYE